MSTETVMSSNHLILYRPLLLLPSVFPSIRVFSVRSLHQVAEVLKLWLQHLSFQWIVRVHFLVWSCSPRDSQEFSPGPQFEGISSLALCLLYGPAFTTIHDHWEDHSLEYKDLCQQSNVSAFQLSRFVFAFLPRSNRLPISWLQSPYAGILEPEKRKSVTTSTFSPLFAMQQWGWMPWSWFF